MSIEELEEDRFLKQCRTCEFCAQSFEGGWCFHHMDPPTKKCKEFELRRTIGEARAINALYQRFPIEEE